jgi:hypothetical protein
MGITQQIGASSLIKPGVCTSTTRPASPYQGQVIYETDTSRTLTWNGTAWYANWNTAWGVLGYQNYTSGSFTVVTGPASTITGISITFTGVANRLYKATFTGECQSKTDAHRTVATIKKGSTSLTEGVSYAAADDYNQLTSIAIFTATGSTTMTVTAQANSTNGSVILGLAAPNNMVFIVEDIGPA